jgi:copper(I)-binding protein
VGSRDIIVGDRGAAYLKIENLGTADRRLVGAETSVADRTEFHTSNMTAGMVSMRRIDSVAIGPGHQADLRPGGMHVMLTGLHHRPAAGNSFKLTLIFDGEEAIEVDVPVKGKGMRSAHDHHHGRTMPEKGSGHRSPPVEHDSDGMRELERSHQRDE